MRWFTVVNSLRVRSDIKGPKYFPLQVFHANGCCSAVKKDWARTKKKVKKVKHTFLIVIFSVLLHIHTYIHRATPPATCKVGILLSKELNLFLLVAFNVYFCFEYNLQTIYRSYLSCFFLYWVTSICTMVVTYTLKCALWVLLEVDFVMAQKGYVAHLPVWH